MSRVYAKDDVEFHSEYTYGPRKPAVNVKIYTSLWQVKLPICLGGVSEIGSDEIKWSYTDPAFTSDWVEEHLTEEQVEADFGLACELGWETLQEIADEIFGSGVKVWQAGRSGGWAVVDGLPDFDYWDAIDLGKWRKFEKLAKAVADGIPEAMMTDIYINEFEEHPE